jgi:hypothetical protein
MARKPTQKAKEDQLRRFKERAEEIGAEATETEFERFARKVIPSKPKESHEPRK